MLSMLRTQPVRATTLLFPPLRMSQSRSAPVLRTLSRATLALARGIATDHISQADGQRILVEQRKNRPMSPHLEIYQPQLTWYLSGLHRITGVGLAFGFYGGLIACAVLPYLGHPFTFGELAGWWATMPDALKMAAKMTVAFPFTFHCWNGVRHLIWDTCHELSLKGVYRTGYAVLGLSFVTALGLAFI